MGTGKLKKFAVKARADLIDQVTARLDYVLNSDTAELRAQAKIVAELKKQIAATSKEAVVDRVAYTWFNRFCALRFMDINRYTRIGIVSPAEGATQPEILAEAKQGHIDERIMDVRRSPHIFALLSGSHAASNPQGEAYRKLLVAACNHYHSAMPYLFERIEDYTELLLPEDLLSENSILSAVRKTLTQESCQDVEVIGWLYQYYISAKKDQVFEDLKKKKQKITPDNIPAATQLFTPHWIVRYLVENSLGRLWMLNNPSSTLTQKMDYYITPEEAETDFLKISSPEEIKICDPACGSGHMLIYAFDLLYTIYEERGYDATEIPELILRHNLYGIELDERAGALAAFALSMKAREKNRRFLEKKIEPNICVLQNIAFSPEELKSYMGELGRDLFSQPLVNTLKQFEECSNFGSLIQPEVTDVRAALQELLAKNLDQNLLLRNTHLNVLLALKQTDYLSPKYHVVVANPPYMGGGNMNGRLAVFAKETYSNSKSDLFAMFIERNLELAQKHGTVAMITMQSWMFLSSFEKLRTNLLHQRTILSMAHLGARAFDSIGGEVVSTTAFVLGNAHHETLKGQYLRLIDGRSEAEKSADLLSNISAINDCTLYFIASAADFKKIPGSPIAYWASKAVLDAFEESPSLSEIAEPKVGLQTGKNDLFIRHWHEASFNAIEMQSTSIENAKLSNKRWFPCNKGGSFRRWYGNNFHIVDWLDDGRLMRSINGSVIRNPQYYFREGITWSTVSSSKLSMRYHASGFMFETKGSVCFPRTGNSYEYALALTNSKVTERILLFLSPTLDFHEGPLGKIPVKTTSNEFVEASVKKSILLSRSDWDSYETSWDFKFLPLLADEHCAGSLAATYQKIRQHWHEQTLEMQRLEEENNRIFIDAYGLADELTPEVPFEEITLTCNPHYRYGGTNSEAQLEAKLLSDTMQELIHYAVGCMFGRYSVDKPGLILANQGDGLEEYLAQVPNPTFTSDADNVIPILDDNWFSDDIVERFQSFLRITFGEEHYKENLAFVEEAIGKDLRKYFTKDFYDYHVRRYKKRPIYWMFSSPKGTFNALIYMHRYKQDTVGVVLNDYLRDFVTKLSAQLDHEKSMQINGSEREKVAATKAIQKLETMLHELKDWERDVLYPLASERIEIDLDDGVKANYQKFGAALKPIKGMSNDDE
jgi:type II restriction/modification system DNA methylase subunit YeeA